MRDVVIPLKSKIHTVEGQEIRYSLRSLHESGLPIGEVWIIGRKPDWMKNVRGISSPDSESTKYQNTTMKLLKAANHDEIREEFYLWNDDMFLIGEHDSIPLMNWGTVDSVIKWYEDRNKVGDTYVPGMIETQKMLREWGIKEPLSYEVHAPMPMSKAKFRKAMERVDRNIVALHKRTVYGNLYPGPSQQLVEDVKVIERSRPLPKNKPFVSMSDIVWKRGRAGQELREMFHRRSPYEIH